MTKAHEILKLGQSIWYDNIRRQILDNGGLQELLDAGVTGVTSNPTIFEKAIVGSHDYDNALRDLVAAGKSIDEIYETLAVEDIKRAATMVRPIYDNTAAGDGYVSLEVSPTLAHDTDGTVAEAKRLWRAVNRPNVMIKVPATPAGLPAITLLIGAGINVNVTLIFSLAQYEAVANAYLNGLEALAARGGDLSRVASVASFFVSRVDTSVDKLLAGKGRTDLQGKAAIANAKIAYARFRQIFSGPRWGKLAADGARVQRPLWASTGTKDPRYPDTLYVDSLIGPHTVNTVPPATLDAVLDHARPGLTLETGLGAAREHLMQLMGVGIDMDQVTQQLQDEGVASFAKSFETLMAGISVKREMLKAEMVSAD